MQLPNISITPTLVDNTNFKGQSVLSLAARKFDDSGLANSDAEVIEFDQFFGEVILEEEDLDDEGREDPDEYYCKGGVEKNSFLN